MQASLDQALKARLASPAPCPDGRFEGRGIVICAGGERYFICAWVLIFILRRVHRSALPIQVWHLGRREMSEEMRLLLTEEGVEVVDAETIAARHPARIAGGWPLKPYAIAQSRFREVLYLNSDTVPLVNPERAFEWDAYGDNGLLLWPDIVDIKQANPIWQRLGLPPVDQVSINSGVLLADKARVFDVLDLAILMNERWDEIYDLLYGDKDTFLMSARLLNRTYGTVAHRPFRFGWDLVQRDPAGDPFLHHRTGSKWLLMHPNRPLAEPSLMANCDDALADLRRRWSGRVFHAPERSARARAEEARLIAVRSFRYQPTTGPERDLELLPGGRIGPGDDGGRHWAVIERAGELVLQFYWSNLLTAELVKSGDRSWQGLGIGPGFALRLEDCPAGAPSLLDDNDRVPRSAADVVAALAEAALFSAGYDAERASALRAALALLNDLFDDVPEQVGKCVARHAAGAEWQRVVADMVSTLTSAREERFALVRRGAMGPRTLDPNHYARPA